MPEAITCPVCGESNPGDMEFCRNCQSRLRPVTGALRSENAPIQPGALPTRKVTSELEPLLPQWLRDARQQARDTAAEDANKAEQEPKQPEPASAPDLLDGLASQSRDDEEDVPEWLAQITGGPSKKKKPVVDDNQVKWVELGGPTQEAPSGGKPQTPDEQTGAQGQTTEKDELTDWFKQAAAATEPGEFRMPAEPVSPEPAPSAAVPEEQQPEPRKPLEDLGWLTNLDAASSLPPEAPADFTPPVRDEVPDWLKKLETDQSAAPAPQAPAPPPAATPPAEVPDWLKQFEEAAATPQPAAQEPQATETGVPDWLQSLPASNVGEVQAQAPEPEQPDEQLFSMELPDWLSSLPGQQEQAKQEPAQPIEQQPAADQSLKPAELPDWVSALGGPRDALTQEPKAATPETENLPDWATALGGSRQAASAQPAASAPDQQELPDWISALGGRGESSSNEEPAAASPQQQPEAPAGELTPEEKLRSGAAFTPEGVAGEDVDAVFASMQTPDWLSAVLPVEAAATESAPTAAQDVEEPIGPAELPSWVQAMRPVESATGGATGGEEDAATEKRGPLAGLRGVLPAIPGAAEPSSKPKSHSIKLDASEQQLAHASLLEQILAAETAPIPMKGSGVLRSQRVLRWAISALMLIVVGAVAFGGTRIFALPSGVPNETVGAISAVEAIPADAPVLVVFDYQPATVGEMEAAGGPLLDHLLLLKHPRLVLISTSPTGSALAERFMSTVLTGRGYVRDQQYIDLGYLPGGLAGVYNFAQSPSAAMPLDAQLRPVWQSSFLAPVRNLSDFAAIIVMTDSIASGQTWIEQTALSRGSGSMVVVASAQAGPMLLPYFDSGQVNGMVSGIYGAVGVEQRNAGSPGLVRRYWDAYSSGLYVALVLITLGALWNLWLGIRDRRAQAVG